MSTNTDAPSIRIVPAAPALPANTLRFYIHFGRPGEAHFNRARLRLLDEEGRQVPDPFLVLSQELWSPDGCRLTVLMEPGRIKRGLGSNPAHEPALVAGRNYALVLDTMGRTVRRNFEVIDAVLAPLDEALWRLDPPRVGLRKAAVLYFDRVVDSVLCETEISIVGPSGDRLPVLPVLERDGRMLWLNPLTDWTEGEHRILISDSFEDICGNRLGEALDHVVGQSGPPRSTVLTFEPRTGGSLSRRGSVPLDSRL